MTDDPTHSTPRWVKLFGIITIILVLLIVVIMFFGGGSHGPGSHAPGMLTGTALLVVRHGPGYPHLGGDTAVDDVIPSAGGY